MTAGEHTARLRQLWDKIDEFFERVRARYPGELACRAGCSECCHRELSLTPVEAAAVRELLEAMPGGARAALASRSASGEACVALEPDGRCAIYEARPLVCRSHGVPIRFGPDPARGRPLPLVDACHLNFTGTDLTAVDADCVLDQTTLSTLLAAIDAARADACAEPRGARIALRQLLGRAAPPPVDEGEDGEHRGAMIPASVGTTFQILRALGDGRDADALTLATAAGAKRLQAILDSPADARLGLLRGWKGSAKGRVEGRRARCSFASLEQGRVAVLELLAEGGLWRLDDVAVVEASDFEGFGELDAPPGLSPPRP